MKQFFFDILVLSLVTILRYFAIAGTFFLVFYKWLSNKLTHSKIQARKASTKDFLREILHSSVSSIMLAITAALVIAGTFATPATYEVNGKQYVVIACGGSKLGAKQGDSYVAYALP